MRSFAAKPFLFSILTLILATAESAHASRARLLVMGTADPFNILPRGSFYYDDNHNLFYNPAYVADFTDWAAIEKSNNYPGAVGQAEGGFFTRFANFNFGLYFNRGDAITTGPSLQNAYTNGAQFRPLELFAGADLGIKVGAALTFGGFKSVASNATDTTLRLGAEIGALAPFISAKLNGGENTGPVNGTSRNLTTGLRYHWGEWTPLAGYRYDRTQIGAAQTTSNTYGFGLGRNTKLTEDAKLNYALTYWRSTLNNRQIVPLDLSVESDMTPWLALRGGLSYRAIDRIGSYSAAGSATSGRIGATLHTQRAFFDFAIGGGSGIGTGDVDFPNFDFSSGLFTAASLTYNWN